MTCTELSMAIGFLANNGKPFFSTNKILSEEKAKRINAIMNLCGFYY